MGMGLLAIAVNGRRDGIARLTADGWARIRAVFCLMMLWMPVALGQQVVDRQAGYTHSVWNHSGGVPDYIYCIAQTSDGWMWLSSRSDLFRFDGVAAEKIPIEQADGTSIVSLYAAKNGDLWIGYSSGQVVVLPNGDAGRSREIKGFKGTPLQFLEDGRGVLWARAINGLFALDPGATAWRSVGDQFDASGRNFYSIALDHEKTMWVLAKAGVFSRRADASTFERSDSLSTRLAWTAGKDEAVVNQLYSYADFYLRGLLATASVGVNLSGSHEPMLTDSNGNLWTFTEHGIVIKAAVTPSDLEDLIGRPKFTDLVAGWTQVSPGRGLSVAEDRQHNIWVGTVAGLEKFQKSVITTVDVPTGDHNYAMLPGDNGAILFGTAVSLHRDFHWWQADRTATPVPGFNESTTAVYRDSDHSVWIGTGYGKLIQVSGTAFLPFSPVPPNGNNGDDILTIARDGQHDLWLSIAGHSTYRFHDGAWLENGGLSALISSPARRMVTDTQGRLWLGYPKELAIVDHGQVKRFGAAEGMDIQNIRDIIPDGVALLAGDNGLAAFDGRQLHRIVASDADALTAITGMVRTGDGTLWINGREGAVRVLPKELARGIADATYKVAVRVFGEAEGMPGTAQPIRPNPTLIEGSDGRLWFANTLGLAWLDPKALPLNHTPPSPRIRSITVGAIRYSPEQLPRLAAGTRQLQIDYTALGLSDATQAHFRYRLNGVDSGWQDAGTRRQAFYSNLGPGTFEFEVIGANEDGAWSQTSARATITIRPFFYQTKWFIGLCIVAAFGLIWLAAWVRQRRLLRQLQQRLEDRHAERERIARELHDTYLQSVQTLIFKIHTASHQLPEGGARDSIVQSLDRADEVLVEGRYRVRALRNPAEHHHDLEASLRDVGDEYAGSAVPRLEIVTHGIKRRIDPIVMDELYASAREALINAFNHAEAQLIRVTIEHERQGLRVGISDDGKGISASVLSKGGAHDHWGLRGIRERMDRLGGTVAIVSKDGEGTTITLFVKSARAYRAAPQF